MSKRRSSKEYYIVQNGKLIPVEEEFYYAWYRPIWRMRGKARRNGECMCTKKNFWKCEGVCLDCPFYSRRYKSLNELQDECGWEVSTDTDMSGLTIANILSEEVKEELTKITPYSLRILEMLAEKHSVRSIAKTLGIAESTLRGHIAKIRACLKKYI